MLEFFVTSKVMHLPFLIKQTPETLTSFRKLVELDLIVLSFIQNYDLLKYYAINLKNIVKNVSGSNRQKIRTFVSGSASAPKMTFLQKERVYCAGFLRVELS